MGKDMITFEEIFKQNERRIHYHIHRLNIHDPHQEFFQEGLVAMWNAYENYQPDQGPMATYFNYTIRNRMIDLIRKQNKEAEKTAHYAQEYRTHIDDGKGEPTHIPVRSIPVISGIGGLGGGKG
ncbi:sigma-70 family RNA polymerase sigma factor [Lentibacillus salicampi]|uniref:Sigma-70 family RNA polymerase sigma factor n=1 Tax=Lentibacillus salicampi TaxID=175306 RepID=A0A4Y9A8N4_9BACI|nr:sigma-70 family RNA polymerase sigma factor [Lentibacillus salicampi]